MANRRRWWLLVFQLRRRTRAEQEDSRRGSARVVQDDGYWSKAARQLVGRVLRTDVSFWWMGRRRARAGILSEVRRPTLQPKLPAPRAPPREMRRLSRSIGLAHTFLARSTHFYPSPADRLGLRRRPRATRGKAAFFSSASRPDDDAGRRRAAGLEPDGGACVLAWPGRRCSAAGLSGSARAPCGGRLRARATSVAQNPCSRPPPPPSLSLPSPIAAIQSSITGADVPAAPRRVRGGDGSRGDQAEPPRRRGDGTTVSLNDGGSRTESGAERARARAVAPPPLARALGLSAPSLSRARSALLSLVPSPATDRPSEPQIPSAVTPSLATPRLPVVVAPNSRRPAARRPSPRPPKNDDDDDQQRPHPRHQRRLQALDRPEQAQPGRRRVPHRGAAALRARRRAER